MAGPDSSAAAMFCGIDVGTQGVRAVITDPDGVIVGAGSSAFGPGQRDGRRHEQDPATWWEALGSAVRTATAAAGHPPIAAVALDATSGTVLVEDRNGDPVGPALMYDDGRAGLQGERVRTLGAEHWAARGSQVQDSWALPKVLWLVESGQVTPGSRVVHQADHLTRRLVGSPTATDTSHSLKTGVDLQTGRWPDALFAELGIPSDILPDVVAPGTVLGLIGPTGHRWTGLAAGTPVRAGMTDGCASQIATGALPLGSWCSTLGTTLVIKGSTAAPVSDTSGAVYSHRNPDGGWLPGGASNIGAGAIAQAFPDATPADLDRLAAHARVPAPGVSYPLSGIGERFPFIAPDATGFLAEDVRASGDDARRFAAVCQSVAYAELLAYEIFGTLGADVSGPVALAGGGSRSEWWNQLRTDVLGRTTYRPRSSEAATGMAILAAAAPGELTATARRMVHIERRYEPDPERRATLLPGYRALLTELAARRWLSPQTAEQLLTGRTLAS